EEAEQPNEAIPLLREVLKHDKSRQRTAGMRLAVVLERTGQGEEAKKVLAEVRRLQDVATIEEGVRTQPDNLELRVRQGELLLTAGHTADGVKMLMSVFDYDPKYRPAHLALAVHFEKAGQPDRAAQHRRAAGDPR
ncbi:MAG TPA: tetratricopeptide repeat protein, partial [Gemmataceae bacterium]|nr:tetratricopeptide repeat protein [Gemmataceae bacterium]